MTIRFRKKNVRQRGSNTHGWGSKKKHRGGGSRGGRGYGGSHKHKFSYITTYEPEHYGYKGFYSRRKKKNAINVGDLEKLSKNNEIDLTSLGYHKLLSKGTATKAFTVKVKEFSAKAKEKIERAGGKIVD